MAGIPRLAWRNLGRNRRRTVITGLALAIGVALSVGAFGWTDGMVGELLNSLTRFHLGHVQVHHPDYPRTRSFDDAIDHPDKVLAAARGLAEVRGVAPRVYSFALVSHEGKSLGVEMVGVDPAREPEVTVLHSRVVDGAYLDATPTPWPRGRELTAEERARDQEITESAEERILEELDELEAIGDSDKGADNEPENQPGDADRPVEPKHRPDAPGQDLGPDGAPDDVGTGAPDDVGTGAPGDPDRERSLTLELAMTQSPPPARPPKVLIGAALARILHLQVGDRLHATGQTTDGRNEEVYFQVAGIFRTGTAQFDRTRMYLNIADLQRFIHLYDKVHEIALVAASPEHAAAVASELKSAIDGQNLLVRPWQEIRPDIYRMLDMSRASATVMLFIIFFVAVLGVVNTMLMSVFERTRELGVLKAIGMSAGRIMALIVTETLILVLASSAVGTLLGFGLDLYMVKYGIDLSSVTGGFSVGGIGLDPVMHGAITARGLVMPTVILSFMCLLASLYPAFRAARLRPAVGMRAT